MNRKRILYVTPFHDALPYSGAAVRSTQLHRELVKEYDVKVIAALEQSERQVHPTTSEENVLRVPFFKPRRDSKNTFQRLLSVAVPGFSAINENLLREAVQSEWLTYGPYDMIYFATQLAARVLPLEGIRCPTVIDAYDYYTAIHSMRQRHIPIYRPYYWIYLKEGFISSRAEQRILRQATVILIPTVEEAEALRRCISGPVVHVLPNGANVPQVQWKARRFSAVLMVANFDYGPNREGLQWFLEHVWLKVLEAHPAAFLSIVGKGSNHLGLDDTSGVRQAGPVADLTQEYLNSACCIIPVLSGGGSRLKLLEAMAYGIPTVSTTFGASGIAHENTISIADHPDSFAAAVSDCLQSDGLLIDRATRARDIISMNYTWERIGQKLRAILST